MGEDFHLHKKFDTSVAPYTQYVLHVFRTSTGPIYLQNGNGGSDKYNGTFTPGSNLHDITHTFTTGNTRSTNIYIGIDDGDTGEIYVSLAKLEKGPTYSDWSPYVSTDIDDSATIRGKLSNTDDVFKLTAGGIYQFDGKVPVNGPTLTDSYGSNWGFFQLIDRGTSFKVLNFWDIFGHHRISIFSGTPGAWGKWVVPNDAIVDPHDGTIPVNGKYIEPVSTSDLTNAIATMKAYVDGKIKS